MGDIATLTVAASFLECLERLPEDELKRLCDGVKWDIHLMEA